MQPPHVLAAGQFLVQRGRQLRGQSVILPFVRGLRELDPLGDVPLGQQLLAEGGQARAEPLPTACR